MSYPQTKYQGVDKVFYNLTQFYNILPQFVRAETAYQFFLWFEKLDRIDRRTLYILLRDTEIYVPEEYRAYIIKKYQELIGIEKLQKRFDRMSREELFT